MQYQVSVPISGGICTLVTRLLSDNLNLIIQYLWLDNKHRYTTTNESFEYGYPHSNVVLNFYTSKTQYLHLHDVRFQTVFHRIKSQIFDVVQSARPSSAVRPVRPWPYHFFWPKMVLAGPLFWPIMFFFFAGSFLRLTTMIKD